MSPLQLPIPNLAKTGWRTALTSPGLVVNDPTTALTLYDSQGILLTRNP